MPTKKKTWSEGSTYTIGRILRPVGGLTKKPHTKILDTQLRNKRTLKNDLKDQVVEKLRSSLDIYIPHNLKPIEKSFFVASEYDNSKTTNYLRTVNKLEEKIGTENLSRLLDIAVRLDKDESWNQKNLPLTDANRKRLTRMAKDLNWLSKYYKNEGKIMNLIEQSSKDEIRYINVSEVLKDVVTIVEHKKDLIHPSLRKNPIVRGIHSGRNTYITYIICTLITECTMGSEEAIGWTLDLLEKYPLKINGKWTKAKISSIFFRRLQAAKP